MNGSAVTALLLVLFAPSLSHSEAGIPQGRLLAQPETRGTEARYQALAKELPPDYDFEVYDLLSFGPSSLFRGSSGVVTTAVVDGDGAVKVYRKEIDKESFQALKDLFDEVSKLPTLARHPSPPLDGRITEYAGSAKGNKRVRTWSPVAAFPRSLERVADRLIEWVKEEDNTQAVQIFHPLMNEVEMLLVQLSWDEGEEIH